MTRLHRYGRRAIVIGYARTALGLSCTLLPLGVMQPALWVGVTLTVGATLFLIDGARCAARHAMKLVVDDAGIRVLGLFGVTIGWDRLRAVELAYYSTRRDRGAGWMQLVIRGPGKAIRVDSDIDGFDGIVATASSRALQLGRPFHERTRINLASLSIDVGGAAGYAPGTVVRGADGA